MVPHRSFRAVVAALCGALLVTTAFGPAAVATVPRPADGEQAVIAEYRTRIPELMAQEHIPGLALAVVDGDHVLWQQGFGVTDSDGGRPVTVDTMFSVQSMSKLFTATAVMQAVDAGQLDLDVPVTRYLPGFTVHSAFEPHPEQRITLRMLLAHTAGFTHEAPLGNNYEPEPGTFDAHVRTISETWLRFPVGTGYAYSNLGIDLAGSILAQTSHQSFPVVVRDRLLAPLGMDHSTFDRTRVHASTTRAVGHDGTLVQPAVDSPMTAAGGLWASAADLARFLSFQLGDGLLDGRRVLSQKAMQEMRTVQAPHRGAPAGYGLGVARTRWRAGQYLDLFSHGGGGNGFLADLWWLPQLQLGVAVLFNSSDHDLQGGLALGILRDLVTTPPSTYYDRLMRAKPQTDVVEPEGNFQPPPDLADRITALALPASSQQARRWQGYVGSYRTGELGTMKPDRPPSRFRVESGVAWFDASEDGAPVRHRLTEFQPGLFLADNGETLDLRGPTHHWRGMALQPVTGGPLAWQWALLVLVTVVAAGWLVRGLVMGWRRWRRRSQATVVTATSGGRAAARLTTVVALLGAFTAVAIAAAVRGMPGLVDVGFLGRMALPLPARLAAHLPLVLVLLAAALVTLMAVGGVRRWWTTAIRWADAALAVALAALAAQLVAWDLVAWGW